MLDRRKMLISAGALLGFSGCVRAEQEEQAIVEKVADVKAPDPKSIPDYDKWQLSEAEWKSRLGPEAFAVLRREATERPWSSPLNDEKREGVYACAGCGLDLFESSTKFDSGTGWPSFFDAIPGRIGEKRDFKLIIPRTEYHCARCGGHQGHVFDDGPRPTGLRYCNNGVALTFRPAGQET